MPSIIGIDSRIFLRDVIKFDGSPGHFESVIGIAVKVHDYDTFSKKYHEAINFALSKIGIEQNYQFYCVADLMRINPDRLYDVLDIFSNKISKEIERVHVFFTLFSKKRLKEVNVYGRLSHNLQIKLGEPTRTYEELLSEHLIQCFPVICAWRLTEFLKPTTINFHLDSFQGHICEASEELESSDFQKVIYPNGDCSNPVISTADLLLGLLDERLKRENKCLIFENIRPALPEFGENVLVYPFFGKHLPKITPLDKISILTLPYIRHPVFWVFKGSELIDSGIMKKSEAYRSLVDYASSLYGVVKMFDKNDIKYFQEGDYGVYLNSMGKEVIESYKKLGKNFKLLDINVMVPEHIKNTLK